MHHRPCESVKKKVSRSYDAMQGERDTLYILVREREAGGTGVRIGYGPERETELQAAGSGLCFDCRGETTTTTGAVEVNCQ